MPAPVVGENVGELDELVDGDSETLDALVGLDDSTSVGEIEGRLDGWFNEGIIKGAHDGTLKGTLVGTTLGTIAYKCIR